MHKKWWFVGVFSHLLFNIQGQEAADFPAVKIHETPAMFTGTCEPSISINPTDPDNIVAGSVLNNVYYSMDGGRTWDLSKIKSTYGVWGDPCLVHGPEGRAYYLHLSDPTGKNWSSDSILDRIVIQWSDDGGQTWDNGSYMGLNHPKDQDKEWAAVNPQTGEVVASWTQFDKYNSPLPEDETNILFSRSTDKGKTWSEPVEINELPGNCLDDDGTVEGAVPSFGPNGEIYVAWSLNEKIYLNAILEEGGTWSETNSIVAKQPGGWTIEIPGLNRSNGMPVTGVDISEGPYKGRLYVCWGDTRNGENNADVFVAYSDDKGKTFSTPKRIHNDDTETHQFLPWMSVDPQTGVVYTVFYDRHRFDNDSTDVTLAYSVDGGLTWENKKLNEESFAVNPFIFFGDYNNISSYNGRVRPIWTEFHNGKLSVWTSLIDLAIPEEDYSGKPDEWKDDVPVEMPAKKDKEDEDKEVEEKEPK
ncbi:MAG: sialidase family protein [Schleiferiaceae bacterium]